MISKQHREEDGGVKRSLSHKKDKLKLGSYERGSLKPSGRGCQEGASALEGDLMNFDGNEMGRKDPARRGAKGATL